jgi:hypothetical protein
VALLQRIGVDDFNPHRLMAHGGQVAPTHQYTDGLGLQILQPERCYRPADVDLPDIVIVNVPGGPPVWTGFALRP